MGSDMDWDDFRFVHTLARAGTVRQAGIMLGVHASTVVRRLDALERNLGVKLFSRTRDGMRLLPAGQEVLAALDRVAFEMETITRRLRARDASLAGPVSLSAPELLLTLLLPDLGKFKTEYPELRLDLRPVEQPGGVEAGSADLAIRETSNPSPDLIGRNLGRYAFAIYGIPELLNRSESVARSEGLYWIDDAQPDTAAAELKRRFYPGSEQLFVSASASVRLAALRLGLGIGPLPCVVGDCHADLARAAAEPLEVGELWLLSHPDLRQVPRVQALSGFVQTVFRRAFQDAA
jgi:DNA-binding transcriptional LysR family regulator